MLARLILCIGKGSENKLDVNTHTHTHTHFAMAAFSKTKRKKKQNNTFTYILELSFFNITTIKLTYSTEEIALRACAR